MKRERFLEVLRDTLQAYEGVEAPGLHWAVKSGCSDKAEYFRAIKLIEAAHQNAYTHFKTQLMGHWWQELFNIHAQRVQFIRELIEHTEKGTLPALESLLS